MGAVMHLQFSSSLSKFTEANTSFDAGVLKIAYTGENRNGSYISKETFENCLHTIYNCPVVCFYDRETDSIGGHDVAIVQGADGALYIANMTTPIGVVPESAKPYWETFTESDGTEHEYLCVDVLLWKRQEAYRKVRADGFESESMEINVFDMEKDPETGLSIIKDFEFTAFCLLGADIEPCFESASIELFSHSGLKQQVAEMMTELKNSLLEINTDDGIDNIPMANFETEGGSDLKDENISTNEGPIEEKFNEEPEVAEEIDESAEEVVETPAEEPAAEETYALDSNLCEQLSRALGAIKVVRPWGLERRYFMVDFDVEAAMVYYEDSEEGWKLFGSPYTMDGDVAVIDFENKTQMKWIIVAFDEGSVESTGAASVIDRYESVIADQNELNEKISSAESELQKLRRFKKEREDSDRMGEIEGLFARFADLEGNESFEALRNEATSDICKYDVDTLEEKCFAIRGRCGAAATFSMKEQKSSKQLVESEGHDEHDPYNGLFQRYGIVK